MGLKPLFLYDRQNAEFDVSNPTFTLVFSDGMYAPCPFCGEQEFDRLDLKHHLRSGACDAYNQSQTVDDWIRENL